MLMLLLLSAVLCVRVTSSVAQTQDPVMKQLLRMADLMSGMKEDIVGMGIIILFSCKPACLYKYIKYKIKYTKEK